MLQQAGSEPLQPQGEDYWWLFDELANEPNARDRITLRTPSVRKAIRSRKFSSVTKSRK
jgi:hypothetical protein